MEGIDGDIAVTSDEDIPVARRVSPLRYRLDRLWKGAHVRRVPLPTIIATVLVLAAAYLGGKLVYRLRDEFLLFLVGGFIALLLNPIVEFVER